MLDFFVTTGWVIRALESVVFLFLVIKFWQLRWSLFFGGKDSLKHTCDHELHSCFISAFNVAVFHFVGSSLARHIVELDMGKVELIKFFYFSMFCVAMAFAVSLILMHVIRGCTFSKTARFCLYSTLVMGILQTVQLVFHGLYDSLAFAHIYQYGIVIVNVFTLLCVAKYPLKNILNRTQKEFAK